MKCTHWEFFFFLICSLLLKITFSWLEISTVSILFNIISFNNNFMNWEKSFSTAFLFSRCCWKNVLERLEQADKNKKTWMKSGHNSLIELLNLHLLEMFIFWHMIYWQFWWNDLILSTLLNDSYQWNYHCIHCSQNTKQVAIYLTVLRHIWMWAIRGSVTAFLQMNCDKIHFHKTKKLIKGFSLFCKWMV